jgi:membrane-associated phospholipid phosphatase
MAPLAFSPRKEDKETSDMHRFGCGLGAALIAGLGSAAQANVVTDWNTVLLNAIRTTSQNPPMASRAMACVHCAIFDAVNSLDRWPTYHGYAVTGRPPNHNSSREAAAAAAAHRMLVSLYPTQTATFDAALASSLAAIPNGPAKNRGIHWGQQCADQIIALRSNDGATAVVPYTPSGLPGYWAPTPPAFANPLLPNWPYVTPWCMDSGDQFRGDGPPALTSAEYAAAFDEVKALGAAVGSTRTPEQSEIALFWADGAGTATPPGHWNLIAQDVAAAEGLSLLETARLFALLNFAVADAAIVSWDNKYAFDHWRPLTGIQQADLDGNDDTIADPAWSSFITTPPFPSYTSGHSTFSGAASMILARYLGTDDYAFSVTSEHPAQPGLQRHFTSFTQASAEAADSRLYGGIHWSYDNLDGTIAGEALGDAVYSNFLRRIGDLNGDDLVNQADLDILLAAWGPCPGGCPADLNGDGRVNGADVVELRRRWSIIASD